MSLGEPAGIMGWVQQAGGWPGGVRISGRSRVSSMESGRSGQRIAAQIISDGVAVRHDERPCLASCVTDAPRRFSQDSITRLCASGWRCAYRCVVLKLSCPSSAWTSYSGTPSITSQLAAV